MIDPHVDKDIIVSGSLENRIVLNARICDNRFPGIVLITGHVIFGMVAGNRHKGHQKTTWALDTLGLNATSKIPTF